MRQQDYQIKHIYVNNQMLMYRLFYRQTKHSYIRLSRDHQVEVIASPYISEAQLEAFIRKHIEKFNRISVKKSERKLIDDEYHYIHLFQKKYLIKLFPNLPKGRYEAVGNSIYVKASSYQNILPIIKDIYLELFTPYVKQRSQYGMKKMKYHATIECRGIVSKGGVCNYHDKKITFALQLGAYAKDVIDYVIVHEIAHLRHPDHSTKFGIFVSEFIPNGKELRRRINLKD